MRILFLSLMLLCSQLSKAQLIFDFGAGTQFGVQQLSNHASNYVADSSNGRRADFDTLNYFKVKAPNGIRFGMRAMASCTLTSPDNPYFFTVTGNLCFQLSTYKVYRPNFLSNTAMYDPPMVWEEEEYPVRYRSLNFSLPILFNVNFPLEQEGNAVYLGLGGSIGQHKLVYPGVDAIRLYVVAEDTYSPWSTVYQAFYMDGTYTALEAQAGYIWTSMRGNQNEFFVSGNLGKGRQGSVQVGYTRRFNFYRG
jgi:hypothetical protein